MDDHTFLDTIGHFFHWILCVVLLDHHFPKRELIQIPAVSRPKSNDMMANN